MTVLEGVKVSLLSRTFMPFITYPKACLLYVFTSVRVKWLEDTMSKFITA